MPEERQSAWGIRGFEHSVQKQRLQLEEASEEDRDKQNTEHASLERDVRKITPRWSGAPQGPKRERRDECKEAVQCQTEMTDRDR